MILEGHGERLQQLGDRALMGSSQSYREGELIPLPEGDFPHERDVTPICGLELPVHLVVIHQVHPPVACADISDRSMRKPQGGSHDQMHILAFGMKQGMATGITAPARISFAASRQMRSQERIEMQLSPQGGVEDLEPCVHEQYRAMGIGEDVLDQAIAPARIGIGEPIKEAVSFRVFEAVLQIALFLVAKRCPVADEELTRVLGASTDG